MMKITWQNGVYEGKVEGGVPHVKGVLTLQCGIRLGKWGNWYICPHNILKLR